MKQLSILGVCQISDSYPNTKYKIELLKQIPGLNIQDNSYHFGNKGFSRYAGNRSIATLVSAFSFLKAHIISLIRAFKARKADIWYVPYPGIFFLWLLPIAGLGKHPRVYLDAFISIYDSAIVDRKILPANSLIAKFLFKIERRAFLRCHRVIVDTSENAQYLSSLFGIDRAHFIDMPLCIPKPPPDNSGKQKSRAQKKFTCVFVGTFVPLQGVPVIVDAAAKLSTDKNIEIILIGDGQDARTVEDKLQQYKLTNVVWHRGHFDNEFIANQIQQADVCLGIFATSDKTQRVLPFKMYHYLAYGKPIISGKTNCLERLRLEQGLPYIPVRTGDDDDLARVILNAKEAFKSRSDTTKTDYFERHLSNAVIKKHLVNLMAG